MDKFKPIVSLLKEKLASGEATIDKIPYFESIYYYRVCFLDHLPNDEGFITIMAEVTTNNLALFIFGKEIKANISYEESLEIFKSCATSYDIQEENKIKKQEEMLEKYLSSFLDR